MPKFIITETNRYEMEAETTDEVEREFRAFTVDGYFSSEIDFLDGSIVYEEGTNE